MFKFPLAGEAGRPAGATGGPVQRPVWCGRRAVSILQISEGEVLQSCAKLCAVVICPDYVPKLCAIDVLFGFVLYIVRFTFVLFSFVLSCFVLCIVWFLFCFIQFDV